MVVFGTGNQQPIRSADRVTQLNDSCWCGDRFDTAVLQRDVIEFGEGEA